MGGFAKRLYHATTPWPLVADCLIWPDTKRWLRWLVPLAIVNTLVLKQKRIPTKKVLNCIWPGAIMCELEETAGPWIVQCPCSAYYCILPGMVKWSCSVYYHVSRSVVHFSKRSARCLRSCNHNIQRLILTISKIREITLIMMEKAALLRTTSLVEE